MDTGSTNATGTTQTPAVGADAGTNDSAAADQLPPAYHCDVMAQLFADDYFGLDGAEPGGPGRAMDTGSTNATGTTQTQAVGTATGKNDGIAADQLPPPHHCDLRA